MASTSVIGVIASSVKRSSGGGVSYGTITGYYNSSGVSGRFCANVGPNQAITVYYAGSGTKTFLEAYNSGSTIFSDTALTTSASSGIYGTQNDKSKYSFRSMG
ncbi:MAG: hypothetical protein EBW42_16065 [Rhodobacterales bacterium]|nr:hypothetical protein [Rhodobacterales bacterium]